MCKFQWGVPFCYWLNFERVKRLRYLTKNEFRQVNLYSKKNVMLSQVKTFVDGIIYMKLYVRAREKNIFRQINFGPHFLSLNCVQTSVGVPFCYGLSLERIRRLRYLTINDFRQVHLESVKNVMLSQVKTFD